MMGARCRAAHQSTALSISELSSITRNPPSPPRRRRSVVFERGRCSRRLSTASTEITVHLAGETHDKTTPLIHVNDGKQFSTATCIQFNYLQTNRACGKHRNRMFCDIRQLLLETLDITRLKKDQIGLII